MLYGHRGNEIDYMENTMDSFINCKYYGIETDVRLTKDNKIVLYHDNNLLRLFNINKNIKDLNYDEANKYCNYSLVLLKDLLDLVKKTNKKLILDIKEIEINKINIILNYTKSYYNLINCNIIYLIWVDFINNTDNIILRAIDSDNVSINFINNIKKLKLNGICLEFTNSDKNNKCIDNIIKNNLIINTYTKLQIIRNDISYFTLS
jgi:glycerophosphoryl diester phosphodiesterase